MVDRDKELRRLGKTLTQVVFWLLLGGTLAYAEADWHRQSPISGPGNAIVATAVTPDGSRAATVTDDGHISLWDLPNRKLIRTKHLPQGKPHHLAIRNQGDAIAIAYEDTDAVIWWCDGSDKVTSLNAKARLVAFANQARKLITVYRRGEVWDIDTGEFLLSSNHTNIGNSLPYLSVLPSDRGAILYGTRFYDGTGFTLEKPGGIAVDWFSYVENTQDTPLYSKQGRIETHYFDTSKIRFVARDITGNELFVEYGIADMFAPVNKIEVLPTHTYAIITYESTYRYTPVLTSGELSHLLNGTRNGGIIIFEKAKPNDWLSFPISWLLVIFGAAFIVQIVKSVIVNSRNKKLRPNPEDATRPLPTATRWACYVIAVVGGLTIVGMIAGLFFDSFNLNFMFLLLPAGIIVLRRKSNGWRKCGVFFILAVMIVGGITLGTSLLAGQPFEMEMGRTQHVAPQCVGIAIGTVVLFIGAFGWHALTDPRAKRICAAATYASQYNDVELRRHALMSCPECGYDTRQTVKDGLTQCAECGRAIACSDEDRAWISRRVDDWRKPLDAKD